MAPSLGGPGTSPPRRCGTRALKNARSLQRLLPKEFPALGPSEAHLLRMPLEELLRLHLLSLSEYDGLDPRLTRLRAPVPGPGAVRGPPFSGTVRFVRVTYDAGGGRMAAVSAADTAVAVQFARTASPAIERYARQYGPARLAAAATVVDARFPVPAGRFTDAQLQTWLGSLWHAGVLAHDDCPVVLAPPGVLNADAPASEGVLGYHGHAVGPYVFVNALGTGFSLADPGDLFALALSHEIAEMTVDPLADGANPEVCDPCGPNCQTVLRDYFSGGGRYLGTTSAFPPAYSYGFYINAIVQPSAASACPAPVRACAYSPP